MSIESFGGSSAAFRLHHLASEAGNSAATDRSGRSGMAGDSSLADLVSGVSPQLNDLIGHHAAMAYRRSDAGVIGGHRHGDSDLRALLKKVLEDGTITPDELAQLKQASSAELQGGASMAGYHPCPHEAQPDDDAGAVTGINDPVTSSGSDDPVGADDPVGSDDPTGADGPVGVDDSPYPQAPADPANPANPMPLAEPAIPPIPAIPTVGSGPTGGSLKLGNTSVTITGGTDAQLAKTRDLFEQMYQKDPGFKQGVDSKAASGLNVTIEDLPPGIQGSAAVGGNTMSIDPEFIGDPRNYANTIAHELDHNLGQQHGAPLEAFAAQAASVVV